MYSLLVIQALSHDTGGFIQGKDLTSVLTPIVRRPLHDAQH